jgi:hypothetical protein
MHRMKIGLIAAIVLLALTAGLYLVVTRELKEAVVQDLDTAVSRAQRIHGDVAQLEAMEFGNEVAGLSHKPAVVGVFDKADENGRRQAAFEQCEQINAQLRTGGKPKADIVAVLDSSGKVLARDLNVNAMFGEDLRSKFPAVGTALSGKATKDIWTLQNRMNRVAVAPITQPDGTIRGVLLVGYVLTARDAQVKHDLLGTEGRLLPQRQGPHLQLHLRRDGREREGRRQQDAGAEPGAVRFGRRARPAGAAEERAHAGLPPVDGRTRVHGGRGAAARECV